jgi:hypothetical protein
LTAGNIEKEGFRHAYVAALLEPRMPSETNTRERGDFLCVQPRCAAAARFGKPGIGGPRRRSDNDGFHRQSDRSDADIFSRGSRRRRRHIDQALISNMFEVPAQWALAIGVWATMFALGMAAGPVVGGLLLEQFWWGSAFLVALPIVAVLLVAGPVVLPEYRDPAGGKLDLFSVALSLLAVLQRIYALKEAAKIWHRPACGFRLYGQRLVRRGLRSKAIEAQPSVT